MQTFTGRQFWPLDARPEDFDVKDIAHSLALQCRFGGHCRTFYSVAEHCVRVSWLVERWGVGDPLAAHCHDGTEAYASDVVRPLKRQLPGYAAMERGIARSLETWLRLPDGALEDSTVKDADEVMLATEARDLMRITRPWHLRADPLEGTIRPWGWRQAEVRYLARYYELRGERGWWRAALSENPSLAWGFLAWACTALVDGLVGR